MPSEYVMSVPMPKSSVLSLLVLLLCMVAIVTSEIINPRTTTSCHLRQYTMRVTKPHVTEAGEIIPCEGTVRVNSCWGRCDSSEIGDYKMPFKISNHPVCTYTGRVARTVHLENCPGHPNPEVEVFDAASCACSLCNPEDTSCENLNG